MKEEISDEQKREWRLREAGRLIEGTYTQLPESWRYAAWWVDAHRTDRTLRDHYAHISVDKVSMIAFTENDSKGIRDRQTRISPGKYLARFFSEYLTKYDIQVLATQFASAYNNDAELLFAYTADEIEHVYTNGPHSCMAYKADHFDSPCHPVRVYAGFDLAVAYTVRNERITGRALCWPEKKLYGRLYGDAMRLETMLTAAGYEEGSLEGARIRKKMHRDAYIIPYLDYLGGAIDRGKHLELVGESDCCDIKHDSQNGLSQNMLSCSACGDSIDEDDVRSAFDEDYCEHCFCDRFSYCDKTGEVCNSDNVVEVRTSRRRDGRGYNVSHWGEYARDNHAVYCEQEGEWYATNICCQMMDGEYVSPEYFEKHAVECAKTGEMFAESDMVELYDGTIVCQRWFRKNGIEIEGVSYDMANLPEGVSMPEIKTEPPPTGYATGSVVECLRDTDRFKAGHRYVVTGHNPVSCMFYLQTDKNGNPALASELLFTRVAGWEIKHDPDQSYGYLIYKDGRLYDQWASQDTAIRHMQRLVNIYNENLPQPWDIPADLSQPWDIPAQSVLDQIEMALESVPNVELT